MQDNETLRAFVAGFYDDLVEALEDADKEPTDAQYRLGLRRLAKAFFDNLELCEAGPALPGPALYRCGRVVRGTRAALGLLSTHSGH